MTKSFLNIWGVGLENSRDALQILLSKDSEIVPAMEIFRTSTDLESKVLFL